MEREKYLKQDNYLHLHNYLNQILLNIELNVNQFLEDKGLKNTCVKKLVVSAKPEPILTYGIYLDFFEEVEPISDKETQVSFVVVLTLIPQTGHYDIAADIGSFYEMICSGWFNNINELPNEAKEYFDNVPLKFIEVLTRFFEKEIPLRSF